MNTQLQPATVRWFNATSGEGLVTLGDGTSLYLHYTSIEGVDKNGYGWPTQDDQAWLKDIAGRQCQVTVYENLYSAQVDKCFGLKGEQPRDRQRTFVRRSRNPLTEKVENTPPKVPRI